jgi:hypothetical protein
MLGGDDLLGVGVLLGPDGMVGVVIVFVAGDKFGNAKLPLRRECCPSPLSAALGAVRALWLSLGAFAVLMGALLTREAVL